MTAVINHVYLYYKYCNEDWSDPRTANWFLVGSPWYSLGIIGFYLFFVYVLGPAFMARRQPYDLTKVIAAYNVVQIWLNGYIVYKAIVLGWFWKFNFICEPVDYSTTPEALMIATTVWIYYMVKIFDLLDTVFFILRKKQNQISFLHVYHHAGMVFGIWASVRYLPGGHGTFLGLVNAFVHMIMYTHYLLTSLKLGKPWWKRYITQLQMFQFCAILVHFTMALLTKDCAYPKWPILIFLPQNLFMMILFSDFYYKTYMKKKPEKVEKNGVPNTMDSKQNGVELPNGKSKTH